ncbi:MAG TPA: long-chain-fatty-acid--CoA ligase [Spirochaetes bacterium]|nr:long-chain-fatty-acid--CoA ligase [Spirochaetota bacterium]
MNAMMSHNVGDLYDRCVTFYRDRRAIKCGEVSYTYGEMRDKAYRLANALTEIGFKKNDNISFLMANCPEYIFSEYALAKCGIVRVPLAVLLSNNDHIYMMNRAECKALIYHERLLPRVMEMIPKLETVKTFICIADDPSKVPSGHLHLQTLIDTHPAEAPRVEVVPEDLCGIYFTGGTTGMPKGVMLSHRSWAGTFITELLEFRLEYDEVFCFATPLTHAGGCLMIPVLIRGGTCLIMDHFDPKEFLELTQKEKISSAFLVPTMLYVLMDHPDIDKYDTSSWRDIIYGASAIAPERLKQAITRFGPVFTQLYGQTEAPMAMCCLPKEAHVIEDPEKEKRVFSSCGRPCFPCQVRIVGEDGGDVPPGGTGEIIIKHINMMDGYLKDPETTAETIKNGWLHTGDMGKMDEEGYLYIVDRCKDMIISGGFNIYPREIEDVLHEHPSVRNAAVIGVPHEKWGEEVKAIVVLYDGKTATAEELIQFVKEKKGGLVAPKSVEFWKEIPLTNLGKIDKKNMRAAYWKDKDRLV